MFETAEFELLGGFIREVNESAEGPNKKFDIVKV